jgi:hypothetical protein
MSINDYHTGRSILICMLVIVLVSAASAWWIYG